MIQLWVQCPGCAPRPFVWAQPILTLGRSPGNDLVFPADSVSAQHAQILFLDGRYVYRDLNSTNGSVLTRAGQRYNVRREQGDVILEPGDVLALANHENCFTVTEIDHQSAYVDEDDDKTILAVEQGRPGELEDQLEEDYQALRAAVRLARELSPCASLHDVASLTVRSCIKAFPKAHHVLFLTPAENSATRDFRVECQIAADATAATSALLNFPALLERCLRERKGYLFLFEHDRLQAIATRTVPVESLDPASTGGQDRLIMGCPLAQGDHVFGLIEIEAKPEASDRQGLTRRDLSLATLMAHLVAARLHELEQEHARLKLARKATAGFLAATVGHCFKNLLFLPLSLSKMLPLCLEQGQMDRVQWLLARNSVNIRYLEMLSNEFASASKDPGSGFALLPVDQLLQEVSDMIGQMAPERVQTRLTLPETIAPIHGHGASLKRLLMNLTLNAVDAFFAQERQEPGLIELRAENDPAADEVCLTVSDTGPGIPDTILTNLREIFQQVRSSADALGELQNIAERVHSTKDQGFKEHYGLGHLFVCQTVQQHHGRLEIESKVGEGTCFKIYLPRQYAPAPGEAETK